MSNAFYKCSFCKTGSSSKKDFTFAESNGKKYTFCHKCGINKCNLRLFRIEKTMNETYERAFEILGKQIAELKMSYYQKLKRYLKKRFKKNEKTNKKETIPQSKAKETKTESKDNVGTRK